MPIAVFGAIPHHFRQVRYSRRITLGLAALLLAGTVGAQNGSNGTPASAAKVQATPLATATSSSPKWSELSPVQQKSLGPLASTWDTMGSGQKRKWIALAQNYPTIGPAEQEKLHSRMAEWAALKPKDRELARLNFAETKKLAPSNRAANWEAYQALSPEEKKNLAERGTAKPVGAAIAIKPVPASKLAEVPVTRRTPEKERVLVNSKQLVNRNTLLPQTPAEPVAIPAAPMVPVADPAPSN